MAFYDLIVIFCRSENNFFLSLLWISSVLDPVMSHMSFWSPLQPSTVLELAIVFIFFRTFLNTVVEPIREIFNRRVQHAIGKSLHSIIYLYIIYLPRVHQSRNLSGRPVLKVS